MKMISTPRALRCATMISAVMLCTASFAMDRGDRHFFSKAAQSGMKEVTVSQTAMDRFTNPQVKSFAQQMVSDHSEVNQQLKTLAERKGVILPADEKTMKLEEKWSKKDKDLDEDYIETMVDDHEDAVKLFKEAAKSEDRDIAEFAEKTLPKLQQHLMMAKDLQKMVK